jgi:leader peptidase (prepilin peptidase)/N-methyltransferase
VLLAIVVAMQGEDAWLGAALVLLLVPVTLIDLEHRIIPNKLTYPGAVVAVALVAAFDTAALPEHLVAGAAAGLFLLAAVLAKPGGMGMGDVKLVALMGLFLGAPVAVALMAGLLSGSLVGGIVMARVGVAAGRKTKIPFGPFLAFGGVVALLAGAPLLDAYLSTF